ncbi:MAG: alpha/beta hydrolase [Proteobacteria bacterium]|nr:alpha/beta hydrolase [Pseudomonadota bacterium]MDA0861474.1 alpha/beta hydrolase [Pseudomonadota bacterium]MDA1031029.1 alpha/beta hydrolase [Pseudomonadota bacterium]
MADFMAGMRRSTVRANGIRMNVWTGGEGPTLVLLHGYPQTGQMWHKVSPTLMKQFNLIIPDLRGYGDSEKARSGFDKKTMAKDVACLASELGHETFFLMGHDRGARVAHRLALDFPERVEKLVVLDIVPTHTIFSRTGRELAAAYWHWFYFQAPDLPEIMIRNSAEPFLQTMFRSLSWRPDAIDDLLFAEYLRAFTLPGTIRCGLEDYRAAATIDYEDDESDLGTKLSCPVYTIWGQFGKMDSLFDVVDTWKEKADNVIGKSLPCGHFIPEEAPDELLSEIVPFLIN